MNPIIQKILNYFSKEAELNREKKYLLKKQAELLIEIETKKLHKEIDLLREELNKI